MAATGRKLVVQVSLFLLYFVSVPTMIITQASAHRQTRGAPPRYKDWFSGTLPNLSTFLRLSE